MSRKSQVASHKSQVASHKSQVASPKYRVASRKYGRRGSLPPPQREVAADRREADGGGQTVVAIKA